MSSIIFILALFTAPGRPSPSVRPPDKATPVKKQAPVPKKTSTVAKKQAPVAKKTAAAAKKTATVTKKTSTVAKKQAPVAKKQAPVAKKTGSAKQPAATIALKQARDRKIHGTVVRPAPAPVHLATVPATPRPVTAKAADKRKVKPVRESRPRTVAYPPINLYQIHLREHASIRVYDENGFLRPQALREFNRLNRCVKTGVVLELDYRLLVELYTAWIAFGMPSVTLYSGCRQAPHASPTSRHNFGLALDYAFDGVSRRELVAWLLARRDRASHGVGLGYYPNSFHIHMDVREKHAFWVDLNEGGAEGSKMVAEPYQWFEGNHKLRARRDEAPPKEAAEQETAQVIPPQAESVPTVPGDGGANP